MKRMISVIIIVVSLFLLLPAEVFASSISMDSTTCEIGETISIKITFNENNIGAVDAVFSYDSDLIEFIDGDNATASSGSGRIILVADSSLQSSLSTNLRFKAIGNGYAAVTVKAERILLFDETDAGTCSGSCVIKIGSPEPIPQPSQSPSPSASPAKPTAKPGETSAAIPSPTDIYSGSEETEIYVLEENIPIIIDGQTYLLQKNLPNRLPKNSSVTNVIYNGIDIKAIKINKTNNVITYITDINGSNGSYYLFDSTKKTFSPVLYPNPMLIILPLPQELPEKFASLTRSEINSSDGHIECLLMSSGISIVFAETGGERDWYCYDSDSGMTIKYTQLFDEIVQEEQYNEQNNDASAVINKTDDLLKILLYAAVIPDIILIAVIIILLLKKRRSISKH